MKKELTDPPTPLEVAEILSVLPDGAGKDVIRRLVFHRDYLSHQIEENKKFVTYLSDTIGFSLESARDTYKVLREKAK